MRRVRENDSSIVGWLLGGAGVSFWRRRVNMLGEGEGKGKQRNWGEGLEGKGAETLSGRLDGCARAGGLQCTSG